MPIDEPTSPPEMTELQQHPERLALLLHQRYESSLRQHFQDAIARNASTDELTALADQIVDNLLYQGKHDEALSFAMHDGHTSLIEDHRLAIEKDDAERCECEHTPTEAMILQHGELRHSWSDKHGQMVVHYRCHKCSHTNATAQPPHIGHAIVKAHRQQNERVWQMHFRAGRSHDVQPQMLIPESKTIEDVKAALVAHAKA